MPEFQRGVAVAYCDSPGPLDKGLDTYFAISPIPDDWSDEQATSFLREYNSRMIDLLAIHEAMPGHYLEGAHSAQLPSTLRAVLRSGLFAEGWAVYPEKMMTDDGYLDGDPLVRLVKLKFKQLPHPWSDEQATSFLREYNSRMIDLLAIHEAMPGHYLEGAHSAQFPSTLRAVLRSGLFAEGWAVYTEKMMTDAGYLDGDPLFRLVQLKFYLRTIANAILDQGVHVDGWSRDQAMRLMTHDTFQQEREAAGKWVRAQLTSAQLPTYFVGVQEYFDTRKAVEAKLGDKFDLKIG